MLAKFDYCCEMDLSDNVNNVNESPSENSPLFPSIKVEPHDNGNAKGLFPVLSDEPKETVGQSTNNWLTNKSFTPNTAQKIHDTYNIKSLISENVDIKPEQGPLKEENVEFPSDRKRKYEKKSKKKKKKAKKEKITHDVNTESKERNLTNHSKKIFIEDVRIAPEHAFYVDHQGDNNNRAFSSMYQYHVARYLSNKASPLGLMEPLKHEFLKKKNKKKNSKSGRYCSFENMKELLCNEVFWCRSDKKLDEEKTSVHLLDYIEIEDEKKTTQGSDNLCSDIYDSSTALYVKGRGKSNSKAEEEEEPFTTKYKVFHERTKTYNKLLREYPDNVALWLEFVDYQTELMEAEAFASTDSSKQNIKINSSALRERKLSILEAALEKNPKSVDLAICKMKLCEDLWESSKLFKEWNNLVFRYPNNIELWKNYLLICQSNLSSFSVSFAVNAYIKCLSKLGSILDGNFQSHEAPENLESSMIEIIGNFSHFLLQTGYTEKGVAIMQAMIELNFFTPDHIQSTSTSVKLEFLEQFWNNNSPRIGEDSALGWKNMLNNNSDRSVVDSADEDSIIAQKHSKWLTWLEIESQREKNLWLPWSLSSDSNKVDNNCEDPERMIFFEDFSSVLFIVKSDLAKAALILQFLSLFDSTIQHSSKKCKLLGCHSQARLNSSMNLNFMRYFKYSNNRSSVLPTIADLDDHVWQNNGSDKFIDNMLMALMNEVNEPIKTDLKVLWCHIRMKVISNHTGSIKTKKSLQKSLKKEFKNFLQNDENRKNYYLWVLFAKFEFECENYSESEKIISYILMSHDLNFEMTSFVYQSYCDILLEMPTFDQRKVVWYLMLCGNLEKFKPFEEECEISSHMILKAKKGFSDNLLKIFESHGDSKFMGSSTIKNWIFCFSLFTYFTSSIESASEIYENVLTKLKETNETAIFEEVYLTYIKLLLYHVNHSSCPLSKLSHELKRAIECFPDNQYFLNLFTKIEERSFISGRQRRLFSHLIKESNKVQPLSWCFAVFAEFNRLENIASLEDTEKSACVPSNGSFWWLSSLFEKASQIKTLEHCVYFWRLYIKFKIEKGYHEKAKSIFYRAVQKCPWAKLLYSDACRYFPEDLQQIHDLMVEKEIRIRTPLEEVEILMSVNETNE